eukprot:gene15227-16801_t
MNCRTCTTRCEYLWRFCYSCGEELHHLETGEDQTEEEDNFNEEDVIKYYFNSGYNYDEILLYLENYHNLKISYRTLLRRLKQYGLSKRPDKGSNSYAALIHASRQKIWEITGGPGSLMGYRSVWHRLELEGIRIPRSVVAILLREIDPEGTTLRKRNKLKRLEENGGCPVELVTDLGTENCIAASIQSFFRDNPDAHRLIQRDLNMVMEHWNTHVIRKSRFNVVSGRPNSLFRLPERFGYEDQLVPVPKREITYVSQHVVEQDYFNEYQEYFDMVTSSLSIREPSTWQEALTLYETLIHISNNGCNSLHE